jgi:hypothetical protein
VLTLSGILKDILLVVLSVIIWSTPITALQAFGYSIALGGLVYYKAGGAQIQSAYLKLASGESFTSNRLGFSVEISVLRSLLPGRHLHKVKRKYFVVGFCAAIALTFVSMRHPFANIRSPFAKSPAMREHPIEELIRTSKAKFEKTLAKQSRTLAEAVEEYKFRYGKYPPPNFDVWYKFARANNVQMIDEFDTIHDLLRPFWGLAPSTIRQNIRYAIGQEGHPFRALFIRNGQMFKPSFEWDKIQARFESSIIEDMTRKFVQYLPDMDLVFNHNDEPSVVIPHEVLDQLVKSAQRYQQHAKPRNSFSERPSDLLDEIPSYQGTNTAYLGHLKAWNQIIQSCPLESPVRQSHGVDVTSSYAYGPLGFIFNTTAFLNVCNQPSLPYHHGFFDRPVSLSLVSNPVPVFSSAKVSSFNDILFPSAHVYGGGLGLDESKDMDWELKREQLHWRGSTTSGFATSEDWRRHERQRFVMAMNNITKPVNILKKVDGIWVEATMSPDVAQPLFDVKFVGVHPVFVTPEAFEEQRKEFEIAPFEDQQELWKWKYLLDVDGLGLSGRFYPLLKSKSLVFKCAMFQEWHNDWIWPWVHYVPLGLNGTDWFETVRFFAQEDNGHALGKRMAEESHQWANRVLREEDFEVWMFRLLLEYVPTISQPDSRYARVIDDQRDVIGFQL